MIWISFLISTYRRDQKQARNPYSNYSIQDVSVLKNEKQRKSNSKIKIIIPEYLLFIIMQNL